MSDADWGQRRRAIVGRDIEHLNCSWWTTVKRCCERAAEPASLEFGISQRLLPLLLRMSDEHIRAFARMPVSMYVTHDALAAETALDAVMAGGRVAEREPTSYAGELARAFDDHALLHWTHVKHISGDDPIFATTHFGIRPRLAQLIAASDPSQLLRFSRARAAAFVVADREITDLERIAESTVAGQDGTVRALHLSAQGKAIRLRAVQPA